MSDQTLIFQNDTRRNSYYISIVNTCSKTGPILKRAKNIHAIKKGVTPELSFTLELAYYANPGLTYRTAIGH